MCTPALAMIASTLIQTGQQLTAPKPKASKPQAVAQPPMPQVPRASADAGYSGTILTGPQGLAAGTQNTGATTLLGR